MNIYGLSKWQFWGISFLLIILPISSSLCIDMYLPAYPLLAKTFQVTEGSVTFSMSIYLLGLAFGQLIYGPLSDRYGRKLMLIIGLSLFGLASLFCSLSHSFMVFLFSRFFQAFGACSAIVLCRAIVTDMYHPEKRTKMLALISATNIFSPALAPLLGGYLVLFGSWQIIFLCITIYSVFVLMGTVILLPESLILLDAKVLQAKQLWINFKRIFTNRLFIGFILCTALLYASVFVWINYSPAILMGKFGVTSDRFGLFFLCPSIGSTTGSLITARWSGQIDERKFIAVGLAFVLIGAVMLPFLFYFNFVNIPILVVTPIMVIFFGTGIASPQLISAGLSQFADIAGFASGIIGFVQTLSGASVGLLTKRFYALGGQGMANLICVTTLTAVLCFVIGFVRFSRTRSALVVIPKEKKSEPSKKVFRIIWDWLRLHRSSFLKIVKAFDKILFDKK